MIKIPLIIKSIYWHAHVPGQSTRFIDRIWQSIVQLKIIAAMTALKDTVIGKFLGTPLGNPILGNDNPVT